MKVPSSIILFERTKQIFYLVSFFAMHLQFSRLLKFLEILVKFRLFWFLSFSAFFVFWEQKIFRNLLYGFVLRFLQTSTDILLNALNYCSEKFLAEFFLSGEGGCLCSPGFLVTNFESPVIVTRMDN